MKKNGFTFIELLVVVTIIGVIFAAAAVSYTQISRNSRDARRRSDLETIRQALEMCRSLAGVYPSAIYSVGGGQVQCSDTNATITLKTTPFDPKPCTGYDNGQYSYSPDGFGGYTLTADCMEDPNRSKTLTNP